MPIARKKSRKPTPLECWVQSRFEGSDAKHAISQHAERIVRAAGIDAPPVSIVKLAKAVGIDPWPIYEAGTEGALKVIDGRMRIVLRRKSNSRQMPGAELGRTRFTYAHELSHALFYDLE